MSGCHGIRTPRYCYNEIGRKHVNVILVTVIVTSNGNGNSNSNSNRFGIVDSS